MTIERRLNSRYETQSLVHVDVYTAKYNDALGTGVGRILNASRSGFLLETNFKIDSESLVQLRVVLNSEIIKFRTLAVRDFTAENGLFCTGLSVENENIPSLRLLSEYLKTRNLTKDSPELEDHLRDLPA